jgi:RNA polymerase sigma factor (sigma-70 family)
MQPGSEDELTLCRRIASGDQQAADEFDSYFRPILSRFLQNRIPYQDHQDLLQDTLLAAFQSLQDAGFVLRKTVGAWLVGILKNKLADYWRSHKRTEERLIAMNSVDQLARLKSVGDSTLVEVALDVERILSSLSKRQRVILLLNLRYGLSTEQVAAALKMPPGSVGRILAEAKRLLRCPQKQLKKISGGSDR